MLVQLISVGKDASGVLTPYNESVILYVGEVPSTAKIVFLPSGNSI